jgi:ribosomal protein S18 acetylase RimI-like enzyme
MEFYIRPYQSNELTAVSRICLRTSDNGQDGTSLYSDPDLPGLMYTSPYVVLEPELAFLLIHDSQPCGYVMGTRDTKTFCGRCEREWFPSLRKKYPLPDPSDDSPDARIIRAIHAGRQVPEGTQAYPAHLHLDLLPIAQGKGWGRKMMQTLIDRMCELKITGVHLDVGVQNKRAIGFYEHMGFHAIRQQNESLYMGRLLE